MKGPWDAFRIASGGNSWDKESKMDTMMEMSVTKCIEIFAECLPSIIIQISAILISGMSKTKILSVTVSALTTGFVSCQISYDFDTDPKNRIQFPDFYGFVPDASNKRTLIFALMTLMPSIQVLIRGMALVILGSVKISNLIIFLVRSEKCSFGHRQFAACI